MICCAVLNPSIRMSWIRKHWDEEYILEAEVKIRNTVRIIGPVSRSLTHSMQDAGIL